jgi:hypothetical protein
VDRLEPLPSRGGLEDLSFPELLMRMYRGSHTGALVLHRHEQVKTIYFQDGRLVFARSSNPDDRLGEFLLRRGTIGLRHYLLSSSRIEPGKRQGTVLCELGAISADELVRCVTDQVTEILYSLFPWTAATFEVRLGEHDTQERIVLAIPIEDVIIKGARRVSQWSRVWRGLGCTLDTVFVPTPDADTLPGRAQLSDDEAHVLALARAKLEVGRILDGSYVSNFDTCRILWALRLVGAVEPTTGVAEGPAHGEDYALEELVEEYDRFLTLVHGFVTERIGDLVDHFMDRALAVAVDRHAEVLAGAHLRNQGRVEYEQVLTNLVRHGPDERHRLARAALDDVLQVLLGLTAKELGPEEEGQLVELLEMLAAEHPSVPFDDIVQRARQEGGGG